MVDIYRTYISDFNLFIFFDRNFEQRRPIYGSDSHLLSSNGHNSSFVRPFVILDLLNLFSYFILSSFE